ncbi:hypothetical protein JRY02_24510, partial [Enterobacter roggenkampii]|nr:hypothetical protein [Enterobacter roggenkampii]
FCFVRQKTCRMTASPYPAYKTCRPGKRSATGHGKPHHPLLETFSPSACRLDIQAISGYR